MNFAERVKANKEQLRTLCLMDVNFMEILQHCRDAAERMNKASLAGDTSFRTAVPAGDLMEQQYPILLHEVHSYVEESMRPFITLHDNAIIFAY